MVNRKFSLLVAACENLGIGINGNLPWRLRLEKHIDTLEMMLENWMHFVLMTSFFVFKKWTEVFQSNVDQGYGPNEAERRDNGATNVFWNARK